MPFGIQLEANKHNPELRTITIGGGTSDVSGNFKVHAITANALARLGDGKIRPYGGVGGGVFFGEIEQGAASWKDKSFGWQALAGADYKINDRYSAFAEYKYSAAKFYIDGIDIDYSVSQFYGGVSYHF